MSAPHSSTTQYINSMAWRALLSLITWLEWCISSHVDNEGKNLSYNSRIYYDNRVVLESPSFLFWMRCLFLFSLSMIAENATPVKMWDLLRFMCTQINKWIYLQLIHLSIYRIPKRLIILIKRWHNLDVIQMEKGKNAWTMAFCSL